MKKKTTIALITALLMCCSVSVYAEGPADIPDADTAQTVTVQEEAVPDDTEDADAAAEDAVDEDTSEDVPAAEEDAAEIAVGVSDEQNAPAETVSDEKSGEDAPEATVEVQEPTEDADSLATDETVFKASAPAKPTTVIKTAFGGRTVQLNCADTDATIYYNFGSSNITSSCKSVTAGETIFLDKPMTGNNAAMYFKAYKNGRWSELGKWGVLNVQIAQPLITQSGKKTENKFKIYTQTKDSYIVYTLDGSKPSVQEGTQKLKVTNGRIIWGTSGVVEIPRGRTLNAIAIRCGLVTSDVMTYTNPVLTEAKLTATDLGGGVWDYYDLRSASLEEAYSYDPSKREYKGDWSKAYELMPAIFFIGHNTSLIELKGSDGKYGYKTFTVDNTNSRLLINESEIKYAVYYADEKGENAYLFLEDDGSTHVFKWVGNSSAQKAKYISDVRTLNGSWFTWNFIPAHLYADTGYGVFEWPNDTSDYYLYAIVVKDGTATLWVDRYGSNSSSACTMTNTKIGNAQYYIYDIDILGDKRTFMFYQWINGDGGDQFYVLCKEYSIGKL